MEMDVPLTDLFWCPFCGFRGLFSAQPAALVKCICGRWCVIGDYDYFVSLTLEEREKMKKWDVQSFREQIEVNHSYLEGASIYS
jgi:hypothetical protein